MKDIVYSAAAFSVDHRYRYSLTRVWDRDLPHACWIMLNPSKADAERPDPTIRKVIGFTRRWGLGGFTVVNLFAMVSPFPTALLRAADPIGAFNDDAIIQSVQGRRVIVGWGNVATKSKLAPRIAAVEGILRTMGISPQCLRITNQGQPEHPLFVPLRRRLRHFRWRAAA